MKTSLFDYHLPKERIAQTPATPRDSSRLLVFDRKTKKVVHDRFNHLANYFRPGDMLVFNNTKVFPARLFGRKETGGQVEVFLLKNVGGKVWEVLIGGKVRRVGMKISFRLGLYCEVKKLMANGVWQVEFNRSAKQVMSLANKIGTTPTPPYIKQGVFGGYQGRLREQYQTVYAKKVGSVAAPTAGFHFTKRLLAQSKKKGVQFEYVTLHVGFGTFQPVKVDDIEKHHMHAEYAEVGATTLKRLIQAKQEGRRIIAVGTTSVRVLETVMGHYLGSDRALARAPFKAKARAFAYPSAEFKGWINTFIYPGYRFKMVDAMITNFHLPKSTLLMLVAAFLARRGIQAAPTRLVHEIKRVYQIAIKKKYRFYSFGDGMMIV